MAEREAKQFATGVAGRANDGDGGLQGLR
jgi:hypothetical protein